MTKWAEVNRDARRETYIVTERMRVSSGWLYRTIHRAWWGDVFSVSAPAFVPFQKKVHKPKAGQP
jgi:hypothetical protein